MGKWRKKPVEVEAIQVKCVREIPCQFGIAKEYNGGEVADFVGNMVRTVYAPGQEPFFEVELNGIKKSAHLGEYIVKYENGSIDVCSRKYFEYTYEKVIEK